MKTFAKIAAAISAFVVLLVILVGVIWIATRPGYSAVALLKVSSVRPTIAFDVAAGGEDADFDIYRQTQMSAVTSIFVIQAALRESDIAQSATLAQQEDKISWLQRNLNVGFLNNGEYMVIALSGDDPDELEEIVNAVKDAYYEEVVLKERREKQVTFDRLQRVWQQTLEDIRGESEKFRDLAESLGAAQADTADASRTLAFRELELLRGQRQIIISNLWDAELAMGINQLRQNQLDESLKPDSTHEGNEVEEDADAALQGLQAGGDDDSALESEDDQQSQNDIDDKEPVKSLKKKVGGDEKLRDLKWEAEVIASRIDHYRKKLAHIQGERTALEFQVRELSRHNVELEERKARLEGLREVANVMQTKLEMWRIELDAPPRVQQVQGAVASPLTWWGEEEETSDLPELSAY